MTGFKDYLEGQEEQEDIQKTLDRLPTSHRQLVKGYSLSFQGTNTINNDRAHVGMVTSYPKPSITIAAPWRYSREVTLLHEIGHLVWAQLSQDQKTVWADLVKKTPMKDSARQGGNVEELFSMIFAASYAKHPPVTYYKKNLIDFIKSL